MSSLPVGQMRAGGGAVGVPASKAVAGSALVASDPATEAGVVPDGAACLARSERVSFSKAKPVDFGHVLIQAEVARLAIEGTPGEQDRVSSPSGLPVDPPSGSAWVTRTPAPGRHELAAPSNHASRLAEQLAWLEAPNGRSLRGAVWEEPPPCIAVPDSPQAQDDGVVRSDLKSSEVEKAPAATGNASCDMLLVPATPPARVRPTVAEPTSESSSLRVSSPGLVEWSLGGRLSVITRDDALASPDDALFAFARSQGFDTHALHLIFGHLDATSRAGLAERDDPGVKGVLLTTSTDGVAAAMPNPEIDQTPGPVAEPHRSAGSASQSLRWEMEVAITPIPSASPPGRSASEPGSALVSSQGPGEVRDTRVQADSIRLIDSDSSTVSPANGSTFDVITEPQAADRSVGTLVPKTAFHESEVREARPTDLIDLRQQAADRASDLAQRLGEAVASRMVSQIERGQWHIRLNLSPEHLGTVDVDLHVRGHRIEAQFSAPQSQTQALLQEGLPRLREAVGSSGMDLAYVEVSGGWSDRQRGNPTHGQRGAPGQSDASADGSAAGSPIEDVPTHGQSLEQVRGSRGALDILI